MQTQLAQRAGVLHHRLRALFAHRGMTMLHRCTRALAIIAGSVVCSYALAAVQPSTPPAPPLGLTQTPPGGPLGDLYARIRRALTHVDQGEADAARGVLDEVVMDPVFEVLQPAHRRELLSMNAVLAWDDGDTARAAELMRAATVADGNDPDDWYRLAILDLQLGYRSRASQQMVAFVKRWPSLVNNLDRMLLTDLLVLGEPLEEDRVALMEALFDAGWNDNGRGVDDIWRELALLHLARDNPDRAAEVIAGIGDPLAIVKIRSDLRFDPLHDAVEQLPSSEAAAAAEVERLRALRAEQPTRIDLAADLGTALLVAGREAEALAESDAVLAAIASAEDPSGFLAYDERIWVLNNKAIALRRAGRFDEAAAQLEHAGQLTENGGDNVSQRLNLGSFLCEVGRPADALRVIEPVSDMSGYGLMVQTAVRHCAALQLDDAAGAARALAYLYDQRADSREIVVAELLRAGDIERAATELIRSLEDPATRAQALESVQQFRTPVPLPANVEMEAHRATLLARADVKAAIARVGRTLQPGVFNITGID